MRVLRILFFLCVSVSAIELVDQSGMVDESSPVAVVAAELRSLRSGDASLGGLDPRGPFTEFVGRVSGSFAEAADALD